jgi:hypothetical protein
MPCSLTLDRITIRRRRRLLRTAGLVLSVALLSPGLATADPEAPPLPPRYNQSVCHALVMDAGRMIAWARWEQRLSLERVLTSPTRAGTPDWVAQLAGSQNASGREPGTQEFFHGLSALVGGICGAGFVIEDLCEPDHTRPGAEPGSFADRAAFLPPYLRILARRGDWVAPPAAKLLVG